MTLVAITRELGSGGTEIAGRVAATLRFPLVHEEIARRVESMWGVPSSEISAFQSTAPPVVKGFNSAARRNFLYIAASLLDAAFVGRAVFRGWGAAQVLRGVEHVLTVHIGAPIGFRLERLARASGLEPRVVREIIRRNDTLRAQLAREHAGVDWRDSNGYRLNINTGHTTVEEAVGRIVELARSDAFRETDQSRRALENLKLEVLVEATLQSKPATRDVCIHVKVTNDEVQLGGIVRDGDERERVLAVVSPLAGHRSVTSRLRAPTDYRTRASSI